MITLEAIKKYKLDSESLKAHFQFADGQDHYDSASPLGKLVDRIAHRQRNGIMNSILDSRIYHAVDKAYDAPFYQVSPTLVEDIISRNPSQKDIEKVAKDWGLTHLLTPISCSCSPAYMGPDACGKCGGSKIGSPNSRYRLDLPAFFRVLVPAVKAYTTIRWAKIYGDRNLFPLFKYEPLKSTALNRLRCEIITDRIQVMSTAMGYNENLRQEILHTLLYSAAFTFPKEQWYQKHHLVKGGDGEYKKEITKEGVRFHTPHPSRLYIDESDRPSTFNTDTGCAYAGYWNIVPWRNVVGNPNYWNKDKVTYGYDWIHAFPALFSEIYNCAMAFPEGSLRLDQTNQRGNINASSVYYSADDADKAVCVGEHFEELIPKDNGLGDYDEPIWMRFATAAKETIVFAEAFPYRPVTFMGYDYDGNRMRNASLALETMPYQDHLGNLLSQYVLSVKNNLAKIIFYNSDLVEKSTIRQFDNLGEKQFRGINCIPFSGKANGMLGQDMQRAFVPVNFPAQNTQEISQAIMSVLNVMERLLGMSAQELGQPAIHEQSATESGIIANNSSTRVVFTGSFIDEGIGAKKELLYDALMANGSDEQWAQIETDNPLTATLLKALGFDLVNEDGSPLPTENGAPVVPPDLTAQGVKLMARGKKESLMLDGFASNRDGDSRIVGDKVAASMVQLTQMYVNNPALFQAIGVDQFIKFFNMFAVVSGLPKDFRIKSTGQQQPSGGQLLQQVQQMVQQSNAALVKQLSDEALVPMKEALQKATAEDQDQDQAIKNMMTELQVIAAKLQQLAPPAPSPAVGIPPTTTITQAAPPPMVPAPQPPPNAPPPPQTAPIGV